MRGTRPSWCAQVKAAIGGPPVEYAGWVTYRCAAILTIVQLRATTAGLTVQLACLKAALLHAIWLVRRGCRDRYLHA